MGRRRGSRELAVALALALALALPGAAAAAPAPLEPVAISRVPLPSGVSSMSFPAWAPDGEHIVAGFSSTEYPNNQIGVIRADGTDFHCITCGLDQVVPDRPLNAGKPLSLGKPFV